MTEYNGPLDYYKMPKIVKEAYASWRNQRQRCYNRSHPHYKYYGAKGILVEYPAREFINWWLIELSKNKNKNKNKNTSVVVCERIDHDKGYNFNNIKLGTPRANTLECASRGVWNKRVVQVSLDGTVKRRFESIKDAATYFNVSSGNITNVCKGKYKQIKGKIFRYET